MCLWGSLWFRFLCAATCCAFGHIGGTLTDVQLWMSKLPESSSQHRAARHHWIIFSWTRSGMFEQLVKRFSFLLAFCHCVHHHIYTTNILYIHDISTNVAILRSNTDGQLSWPKGPKWPTTKHRCAKHCELLGWGMVSSALSWYCLCSVIHNISLSHYMPFTESSSTMVNVSPGSL